MIACLSAAITSTTQGLSTSESARCEKRVEGGLGTSIPTASFRSAHQSDERPLDASAEEIPCRSTFFCELNFSSVCAPGSAQLLRFP